MKLLSFHAPFFSPDITEILLLTAGLSIITSVSTLKKLFDLLCEQILAGLCFSTSIEGKCNVCSDSKREEAARLAAKFISKLPAMRRILATDVEAAYNGDPAAESYGEVIFLLSGH